MKKLRLVGLALVAMAVNVHAQTLGCITENGCISIVATTPEQRAADDRRRAEERARKDAEIRSVGLPPQRRAEAEALLELQRAAAAARGEKTPPSAPSKLETTVGSPPAPPRVCKWNPKKEGHLPQWAKTEAQARAKLNSLRGPFCANGSPSEVTSVSCNKVVGLDTIDSKGRRIRGTAEVSFSCSYGWVCAQGFETCSGSAGVSRQ